MPLITVYYDPHFISLGQDFISVYLSTTLEYALHDLIADEFYPELDEDSRKRCVVLKHDGSTLSRLAKTNHPLLIEIDPMCRAVEYGNRGADAGRDLAERVRNLIEESWRFNHTRSFIYGPIQNSRIVIEIKGPATIEQYVYELFTSQMA